MYCPPAERYSPLIAGKNIHLAQDLHLQNYIESLLAGQHAVVLVEEPYDGSALAMVSMPSYDPINRMKQGLYPPSSTVKPYMAMSALLIGIITPQTTFFGAST